MGAEVEPELRKVGTRSIKNRIFPPSFFTRTRRLMMRDYLRWQTAILQGFLRVISVAARFLSLCCRQEVRLRFDIETSWRAQRYVANFVSRNFESGGRGCQANGNYLQKQRLGGFHVADMCVHILQHPSEKGL
jgi:hypothetical protein